MNMTQELIQKSQNGDESARDQLVRENSGLIWSVARRFTGRGTEMDDLYQLGCLGFLKAVDGFDPEFGTQFSTYAVPKIAGEIRRFLRDDGTVKVSRTIKERSAVIRTAKNMLANALGREPTISELSTHTGIPVEEIAVAENAMATVESIHQPVGEEGFRLENILTDSDGEEEMLEKVLLRQALQALPEREAMVIRLRFYHGLTQDRVSRVLDVSQVQVSRIEKKAIQRLRELMQ